MSISAFEQLCEDFCALTRVPPPALEPEDDGVVAFHATWHGVSIDVLHHPEHSADHAFVLFELGPVAPEDPQLPRILSALLQANFLSMRLNAPTFSCHPQTGAAVLQCTVGLAGTPAGLLFQVIEEGTSLALGWRKTFFLEERAREPAPVMQSSPQSHGQFA